YCVTLRIKHRRLRHDDDLCFHPFTISAEGRIRLVANLPDSRGQAIQERGLLQDNDIQRSFAAKDVDAHVPLIMPCKQKIHARVSYLQPADGHLLEKTG